VCLWVAHQSNASLKMLNRNSNAIANANVEYLKGKRKTRTKMFPKVVVGNRQRIQAIEMKLELMPRMVNGKLRDRVPQRININMLVIVCTLKQRYQIQL